MWEPALCTLAAALRALPAALRHHEKALKAAVIGVLAARPGRGAQRQARRGLPGLADPHMCIRAPVAHLQNRLFCTDCKRASVYIHPAEAHQISVAVKMAAGGAVPGAAAADQRRGRRLGGGGAGSAGVSARTAGRRMPGDRGSRHPRQLQACRQSRGLWSTNPARFSPQLPQACAQ